MISEKKDNQIWTCYDLISPNPNINELRLIGLSDLIDKLYGKGKDMERGKGKR